MERVEEKSMRALEREFPEVSLIPLACAHASPFFYRGGSLFLSLFGTTEEEACKLVSVLLVSKTVTSLRLYGIFPPSIIGFVGGIRNGYMGLSGPKRSVLKIMYGALANPNITELDSRHYPDLDDLIEALEQYPHVQLKYLFVDRKNPMEAQLRLASRCKKVVMSEDIVDSFPISDLSVVRHLYGRAISLPSIGDMPNLTSLSIVTWDMTVKKCKYTAEALRCHPSITKLIIYDSNIRHVDCSLEKFFTARSYKSISLSANEIKGTDTLEAIASNRELRKFCLQMRTKRLSFNNTAFLLEALATCPLRILVLNRVKMDKRCWQALDRLEKNGLQSLVLLDYRTEEGQSQFWHSLTNLRSLDISSKCFSTLDSFSKVIRTNTTLRHLSIRIIGKGIIPDVHERLGLPLMENITLRSFYYSPLPTFNWLNVALLKCRNDSGWSPIIHDLYSTRMKESIKLLFSAQYTQTRYPTYSFLPREVMHQILRYL